MQPAGLFPAFVSLQPAGLSLLLQFYCAYLSLAHFLKRTVQLLIDLNSIKEIDGENKEKRHDSRGDHRNQDKFLSYPLNHGPPPVYNRLPVPHGSAWKTQGAAAAFSAGRD